MGVILNAVNQTLRMAGAAARFSPEYEIKQKAYALEQEKKKLISEGKTLSEETKGDIEKLIIDSDKLGIPKKIAETNEKLAYLGQASPELAAESLRQAEIHSDVAKGLQAGKIRIKPMNAQEFLSERLALANKQAQAISLADKQEQAMQNVAAKQETQKQQKRNFMEYLGKLETSMGMKVGDLPLKMLKEIAKQYTKSERKKLMDEGDKNK